MGNNNTYTIQVTCDNCDFYGEVKLPKGTPATHSIECPNCGCKTAHKPQNKILPLPRTYPPMPKDKPWIDDWWEKLPNQKPYISTSPAPRQILEEKSYYDVDNDISWLIPVIS